MAGDHPPAAVPRGLVRIAAVGGVLGAAVEMFHRAVGVWVPGQVTAWQPLIPLAYFVALLVAGLGLRRVEEAIPAPAGDAIAGLAAQLVRVLALALAPVVFFRLELPFAVLLAGLLTVQLLSQGAVLKKTVNYLAIFAALLSVTAILQRFTSPDKILWFYESPIPAPH